MLNVGYQAQIINQRLFSMFVLVAVILTFITTPFTLLIYPEKYRIRGSGLPRPLFRKDKERRQSSSTITPSGPGGREITERFLVVLQKVEHLSAVMFISQLLEPGTSKPTRTLHRSGSAHAKAVARSAANTVKVAPEGDISDESNKSSPSRVQSNVASVSEAEHAGGIRMDALKLIELTGRTYSVMQSAEKDSLLLSDDTLQLFKQYGRLRGFEITPHLDIVATDSYHNAVADLSLHIGAELILLPWTIPHIGEEDLLVEPRPSSNALNLSVGGASTSAAASPVNSIFGRDAIAQSSSFYSDYVRKVFNEATADVALFVDRGFGSGSNFTPGSGQHIFMPFFGGADDRLALRFVVQLCANEHVTATVVRFEKDGSYFEEQHKEEDGPKGPVKKLSMGAMAMVSLAPF